jgi:putative ABC transport system permease protein
VGAWLGRSLTGVYAHIFRCPYFEYALGVGVPLAAAALSFASAAVGAVATVRRIVLLPPAEAMRPPAPSVYRPLLLERLGLGRLVSPAGRMVVRELERQPLRTVLSVLGIATALGTLIVGQFTGDAFRYLIQVQFSQVTREDLSVELRDPVAARAARELAHLPGVWRAEGVRTVPVRIEAGHRYREIPLVGYEDGAQLRRVISRDTRRPVPLPPAGLVVTRTLGEVLGVGAGDTVLVKLLQGERAVLPMIVAGMVDELVGLQGYLRLPALNALLAEPPTVSQVLLAVEGGRTDAVIRRLGEMPGVSTITRRSAVVELIERQSGESMAVVSLVLTIFAATIAVGVVYNNARVVLSLRSRDLASLRVLGFSRAEISRVLLNELGLQVLLAIPTGMVIGTWLTGLVVRSIHQERFRFPVVLSARTYAFAILVVLAASAASALLVRRGLDRLDLIGVLKTRE